MRKNLMPSRNRVKQVVFVERTTICSNGYTTRIRVTTDPDGDSSYEIVLIGQHPNLEGIHTVRPSDTGSHFGKFGTLFEDEFKGMLTQAGIEFDERYLWS